jgi:peptidoglycan lytic transglycosylase
VRLAVVAVACLGLAHCSSRYGKYGVSSSPRLVQLGQPAPKGGGTYHVGKPYVISGHTYVPREDTNYDAEGVASWYGDDFHGRLTANGEIFDENAISAAHPTLPLPSYVRVTNLANKRSLIVRVNDRGPYVDNRVIDLSIRAAKLLGFYDHGLAKVRVEYVGPAPLQGSDDRQLLATLREGAPAPPPSLVRVASARPFLPENSTPVAVAAARPKPSSLPPKRPAAAGEVLKQAALEGSEGVPTRRPPVGNRAPVQTAALPAVGSVRPMQPTSTATLSTVGATAVSAFAPTRYDAPAAFLSGRGLY